MPWATFDIPSDSHARLAAENQLLALLSKFGFDDHAIFGIRLAFDEAMANAIKHGNHGDAAKTVHIRIDVSPERAVVEIEDEGAGFCPDTIPDPCCEENLDKPHGRGILLMRSFMDEVAFEKHGRLVRMTKHRATAEKQAQ